MVGAAGNMLAEIRRDEEGRGLTSRAPIAVVLVAALLVGGAAGITYVVTSGGSSRTGIVTREVNGCTKGADCDQAARSDARFVCAHTHASVVEQPPTRGGYAVTVADRTIGVDFGVPEPYELIRGDGSRMMADGDDWWSRNVGPYAQGGP